MTKTVKALVPKGSKPGQTVRGMVKRVTPAQPSPRYKPARKAYA